MGGLCYTATPRSILTQRLIVVLLLDLIHLVTLQPLVLPSTSKRQWLRLSHIQALSLIVYVVGEGVLRFLQEKQLVVV